MSTRRRNPMVLLTVALFVSVPVLIWLVWYSYSSYRDNETDRTQRSRIEQLRGTIVHLDEVLTMSARMAAATGDVRWEQRYRKFEPKLDAAIKEAIKLAPEAYGGKGATETDAANIKLVAMENLAFDLVRKGRADEAKKLLFSDEYEKQKHIYAQGMTRFADSPDSYLRLVELRGSIIHMDEVLTMSARMAAATGDPRWEQRYREFEPKLDATIKEAMKLAPEAYSGKAAGKTDEANIKLVEMENRAFDLVRRGDPDQARTLLFSDEYETQKKIYAEGMTEFAAGLSSASAKSLAQKQRQALARIAAVVLVIPLMIVGWFFVSRTAHKWTAALRDNNLRLAAQAKELAEYEVHLEELVRTRTSELEKANQQLQSEIAERERADEALRDSEERYRAIFEQAADSILLVDPHGRILEFNDRAHENLGYTREEFQELKIADFEAIEAAEQVEDRIQHIVREGSATFETKHRTKSGEIRDIVVTSRSIEISGGHFCLSVLHDITERKRAEDTLQEAKVSAEAANAAKSEFLANMSHEIRTPMTAILGYTELLRDPTATASDRDNYLAVVERNGQHLLMLINDILDLSKIEAGKLDVQIQRCGIISVVADVGSIMRARARERDIRLSVEFASELPQTTLTDIARLRQALINLVGNAVKFTEKGSVRIVVTFLPEWRGDQPAVQFQVIDTGIGISQEKLERIFQPFTQADSSTSRKYGGTGLGLAITNHIAELLGGQLTAESTPGEGSTFTLTIPTGSLEGIRMLPRVEEVARQPRWDAPVGAAANLTGIRVLLAEDGPDNQRLITTILSKAGAEVTLAENGRIAVERALHDQFDLILMDIQMSEMDGYQATRKLRKRGVSAPIVALTAHAMSGDREKCLSAGCTDYMAKPINRRQLLEMVMQHTGRQIIQSEFDDNADLAEVIDQFVAELPGKVEQMRADLANGCFRELRWLAHQLRGTGGSYGYPALTDAAKCLEDAASAPDTEDAILAMKDLVELVQSIVASRQQHSPEAAGQ